MATRTRAPLGEDNTATEEMSGAAARQTVAGITPGRVLAERYELGRVLGQGGMGVVLLAWDRLLEEDVAIKVLRPEMAGDRRWTERLVREVKLARQIHHPNVCRVFDFVQADGHAFLVMEQAGGTLRDEIEQGIARPVEARLADVRAVAAGLAAIHGAGLIHRDVSAQNVLRMADGRLVVSDFGLAMDVEETSASIYGGTVAYMAPELAMGGRPAFASDIWALGIVIHEIAFGVRPTWRGQDVGRGIARRPGPLTPVERAIFEVCRSCTATRPEARPPNGAAVAARLRAATSIVPLSVRRRATAAMVVTLGLALAVVGASSLSHHRGAKSPDPHAPEIDEPTLEITGTPEDGRITSRVLATVDGPVLCIVSVPSAGAIRFVWGDPRRAEDVDIVTGVRRPSPLVPAAYAEGCPDLSPDGRALVFQGQDREGRPFIFRAAPDGSGAQPLAPSGELAFTSEPRWVGNDMIAFNVDDHHAGVLEVATNHILVLPEDEKARTDYAGWTVGDRSVVVQSYNAKMRLRSIAVPEMVPVWSVRLRGVYQDCLADDPDLWCLGNDSVLLQYDVRRRVGRRVAKIPGLHPTLLARLARNLVFVGVRNRSDAWLREPSGVMRRLTNDGSGLQIADCGASEYLVTRRNDLGTEIVRITKDGGARVLTTGRNDVAPMCSRISNVWWFVRADEGLFRCVGDACRKVSPMVFDAGSLSPDERRIAYFGMGKRGYAAMWMDSGGGTPHEVADSEGQCTPGWASNDTLWVSRRIRGTVVWTEVRVQDGAPTGRTAPAGQACGNKEFDFDPLSPVDPHLRITGPITSEIRIRDLPSRAGR